MSEGLIIRNCSPTLAGMKPGSMFSCSYETIRELQDYMRRINRALIPKGIRALLLRHENGRALIYIFRPKDLSKILEDELAVEILQRRGYRDIRLEPCICQLMGRIQESDEFPHEIGLFLGYPPEDVKAFIENKGCNHKCVGCWKVYGDEEAARKTFDKYRMCTAIYWSQWEKGQSMERLAVAG